MVSDSSAKDIESWLEANSQWTKDYYLRTAEPEWIRKWLARRGLSSIGVNEAFANLQVSSPDLIDSVSQSESSNPTSPEFKTIQDRTFFPSQEPPAVSAAMTAGSTAETGIAAGSSEVSNLRVTPQRSNSKKYLRKDFARSKTKSLFRTHDSMPTSPCKKDLDGTGATAGGTGCASPTLSARRRSLKGMRQFHSLPSTSGYILSILIQSKVRLPRYASKDEDRKRELKGENDRDFFLEIVRDISHELDLTTLTSKILVNISILVDADRSSLFFVEGAKGGRDRVLVSKVFDAYTGTNCLPTVKGDNVVRVPWGEGIIGHVAKSGEIVNIKKVSEDSRYNDNVDKIVGYQTDSLLCIPIRNADDDVIAVAQVANKRSDSGYFTKDDEKILETYTAFCGMAVSNAQAIEAYTKEYDRNKALLQATHDLFEEQTSVENVIMKIMQRAQALLKCERCVVILHDGDAKNEDGRDANSTQTPSEGDRVFDLHQRSTAINGERSPTSRLESSRKTRPKETSSKRGQRLLLETHAIDSANGARDGGLSPCGGNSDNEDNNSDSVRSRKLLCKPIRNNKFQTIGVAQLFNKTDDGDFDENDEHLLEAFTIFCGLGINNCMLYDKVARASAKQAVALEVLSYHATVSSDDVCAITQLPVPAGAKYDIYRADFDDFLLGYDDMLLAAISIFNEMGFLKTFNIEYETLVRWLLTVRKNYRNVAYHNWRHAFNVCQFMFVVLTTGSLRSHVNELECLAFIVASLCHDLDHRGTNNAFQQKSSSPLSQLYGTTATLEHHHFNHAVMILNSEGHNIFINISSSDYSVVMNLLKQAIIATDLSLHMQVREAFIPLVEGESFSWENDEHRGLFHSVLMTSCDIASITKPWNVQRKAAELVMTEFFEQGDKERTVLKIQPQAIMDREKEAELPRLQLEWIDGICHPLYKNLAHFERLFEPLFERVLDNRRHWERLDQRRRLLQDRPLQLLETEC